MSKYTHTKGKHGWPGGLGTEDADHVITTWF